MDGWRIYDVAGGDFAVPLAGSDHYDNYDVHYIPAERVYRDAPVDRGYKRRGDRWVGGRWIRGRQEPAPVVKGN